MAGIGFTLRNLTRQDNMIGVVQGYAYATFVTSGPWLFTILALTALNLLAERFTGYEGLSIFRLIIIYNFSFSLILSAPVTIIVTRYLADRIYGRDTREAPGLLVGGLAAIFLTQLPLAVWFYGFFVDLHPTERLAAVWNYALVAALWLTAVFLTALKDYRTVSAAFLGGMLAAFAFAALLVPLYGVSGLALGFNAGLTIILFVLIARIFAEYPGGVRRPFAFLAYYRDYWTLALTALFSNLALWVDKWIMWFAPEGEVLAGHMIFYPHYDSAMFLAYTSILPALSMFVMHVETSFFVAYQRFYRDIDQHCTLDRMRRNHRSLVGTLLGGMRNIVIIQGAIAVILVLLSPRLFQVLDLNYTMIGIYRFGVVGSFFQVLLLFTSTALAYFDLRQANLMVHAIYLACSVVFTMISLEMGFQYYGLGYVAAGGVGLLVAYTITFQRLSRLPYLTFVGNNPSVR